MALRGPTRSRCCLSKWTLAVAAETAGAHVDRLDHGAPRADQRAFAADDRATAGDHRDVGGGPAHIRNHEVGEPRESPAPTTLAAGPDRMVSTGYSSAISAFISEPSPLTIINGASNASLREHLRQRLDQVADLRRQARVQRGRQRPPRRIELGTQFVRAGHRLRRQRANQLARPQFMRRIAHGKIGGDCECLDTRRRAR